MKNNLEDLIVGDNPKDEKIKLALLGASAQWAVSNGKNGEVSEVAKGMKKVLVDYLQEKSPDPRATLLALTYLANDFAGLLIDQIQATLREKKEKEERVM